MNTSFDILVITLGCLLGIFLILSITLLVKVLKLVNSVKNIVAKGEQVVLSAESAADAFKKAAGPLGALKTITNIIEEITKHTRK